MTFFQLIDSLQATGEEAQRRPRRREGRRRTESALFLDLHSHPRQEATAEAEIFSLAEARARRGLAAT